MSEELRGIVEEYRFWKRRHPNFPLTVHPRGQWSKKICGRTHYFGPLSNPEAAQKLWLRKKDHLLADEPFPVDQTGITVRELLDEHLADVDDRISVGKLARKTRRDYLVVRKLIEHCDLTDIPVAALRPKHFTLIQKDLEKSGRSLRTQRNLIMATKVVFNWGQKMELFDCDIRYGPRFVAPSLHAVEIEREENGNCRFLDRELILAALKAASPKLKIAILLGINCGFYPGDTIAITLDHLHLDGEIPYHDFRRVKTGRRRMAVLWPETVETIQSYRHEHRDPIHPSERCLLLSQLRYRYSPRSSGNKLIASFNRFLEDIGDRPRGVSLGSLRHTYATVVDLVPDQAMIDLTMGHTNTSIQKRYYLQFNLEELPRLQIVANRVHEWLFKKDKV